jgi:hypothetical protein
MRGNEDNTVGRLKAGARQVHDIARRRSGDRWRLGLRLIKQGERTAARPADKDNLLVAATLGVLDPGPHVDRDLLDDEPAVVFRIAACRAQDMQPRASERRRHRQQLQSARGVHEQIERR